MPTGVTGPLKAVARKAGLRRVGVAAARARWERGLLAAVSRREPSVAGRILCYHGVGTPSWGINDMGPERFRSQLELALRWGYRFVPASLVAAGLAQPRDIAITFDDGLMSVATEAAPVLTALRIPWTVFIVSNWADGKHGHGDGTFMGWRDIERIAIAGAEIGSHSVTHPNFSRLSAADATWELTESRYTIERCTGIYTDAFAIPMGRSTDWSDDARQAAATAGYRYVYAQSVDRRPDRTVPRTFITRSDMDHVFKAALEGAFDRWEEWV